MAILTRLAMAVLVAAVAQPATFRSNTHLVEVTVVVRDRDGKPATNLTAADFQVFEDGHEQTVSLFSPQTPAERPAAARPAANVFTNGMTNAPSGVTVLLFDRLNTEWTDQAQARRHVLRYLSQLSSTERVALYLLEPSSVRIVHDFTSDAASLRRAAERMEARESRQVAIGGDPAPSFAASGDPRAAAMEAQLDADLARMDARIKADAIRDRVESTLNALEAVARHLAGISGRKNLIWISSAFPLDFDDGFGRRSVYREVNLATRAITDADVAVYPVDARGLLPAFAITSAAKPVYQTLQTNSPAIDSMRTLAERTGGQAYYNRNDLAKAIDQAVEESRVTYVLGYYPTNTTWDGHFRKIAVKVKRRDLDVRHRTGYIALPPPPLTEASRQNALVRALRSPLSATGLLIAVTADPGTPGELNLAIRVDAAAVALQAAPDGTWVGSLDVAIARALPDGALSKALDITIPLRWSGEMRDRAIRDGLILHRTVKLQAAEELRIAIRDPATGSIGTVNVPVK